MSNVVHSVEQVPGAPGARSDRAYVGILTGIANVVGTNAGQKVSTDITGLQLPSKYNVHVNSLVPARVTNKTPSGFTVDLFPVLPVITSPAAPTVTPTGTTGATNYSYTVAAVDERGGVAIASSAGTTATGNATLDGTNYNALSCAAVPGATRYAWYRTVGGATQGLIGVTTTTTFNDTGIAATTSPGIPSTSPSARTATVPAGTFDCTIVG